LRDDFPGTEVGEDTDISLRVRKLGYRVVFNPAAVLLHVGAPQAKGKRFNIRYEFYHRRNNFLLLMRNFGPGSIVWRYLLRTSYDAFREAIRKIAGAVLRVAANFAGAAVGIGAGIAMLARNGRNPARNDAEGRRISEALTHVRAKMPTVDDIQSDLASPSAHREVF
jgi:GT2 family glycosyltransferase